VKVGYCIGIAPHIASYRLRAAIPAPHLGCEYELGNFGDVTFFYKHAEGDLELAESCGPFVYDVVNDHFANRNGGHYRSMIALATAVTCGSDWMRQRILDVTGRAATVIDDPYENDEQEPAMPAGDEVLWFGHRANISSLVPYVSVDKLIVCSNIPDVIWWTPDSERRALDRCGTVLLTSSSPGASTNRVVKALRAGRFVVTPGGVPAWDAFAPFIWIGDVAEGVEWARTHREEACQKVRSGQEYARARNSPAQIARQWMAVFGSISPPGTSGNRDGSPLI
jgi:hypothetical protein